MDFVFQYASIVVFNGNLVFVSINLFCQFFDEISLLTVENSFYHDYTKYTKSSGRIKAKMIVNLLTFANIMLHPFGKMYGSKISLF